MNHIKIVEYHSRLAAAVADMWNHSQDGWGDRDTVMTEETVRNREENSINLNVYIAMDEDRAVGYCSLSQYREDEGALYIPLLNVRSGYRGKKIGKQLVFKALERTIELGWPRLDLYTWPGNTRAVPLYKKCGFFWEERDDTTHLMNFIPTVLTTDAVRDFFQEIDWYEDSKRVIEIKPDGRKENGFDYYEYIWEKDGKLLRMEFERSGRGLRLIETNDYLISATVEDFNLVYGSSYRVRYEIINKSKNMLSISLTGINDKNIQFDFQKELLVEDRATVDAFFYVGEIDEEQSTWRTHPAVITRVKINGREALFKVGVKPNFPAKITCKVPDHQCYLHKNSSFYMEIENNYNEEVTYTIQFPNIDFIQLLNDHFEIQMKSKEKRVIAVPYRLKDFGFYDGQLEIFARKKNGEEFSFKKKIGVAFKGLGAKFFGECEEYWHIYNGLVHLWLRKFDNRLIPARETSLEQKAFIFYPKLGKPFSSEFSKKKPERVEFFTEGGVIGLKVIYVSKDFSGFEIHSIAKLYAEGLVETFFEVHNRSDEDSSQDIWLNNSIYFDLSKAIIPYDGEIVAVRDMGRYNYWDSERISENWIFAKDQKLPLGISWHQENLVKFEGWFLFFDYHLGRIPHNAFRSTKSVTISLGAYYTWEDFRNFALRDHCPHVVPSDHVRLYPERNNPVIGDLCKIIFKDYKSTYLDGSIMWKLGDKAEIVGRKSLDIGYEATEVAFEIETSQSPIQLISVDAMLKTAHYQMTNLLIKHSSEPLKSEVLEDQGHQIYKISNGILEIRSAPDFFPTLYSLSYDGREWLDTSFPHPIPKSWWNPWVGGIRSSLMGIRGFSIQKEKRSADFVIMKDHYGNQWEGIVIRVSIQQLEKYKGLKYNQYYLMLPGVPILCHFTEIFQESQQYLHLEHWFSAACFKPNLGDGDNGIIQLLDEHGTWQTRFAGRGEMESISNGSIILEYASRPEKLQIITNHAGNNLEIYSNREVLEQMSTTEVSLNYGERYMTSPVYYLFTDRIIPENALQELRRLSFKHV